MEQVLQNMNRLNRNLESIITVRPPPHLRYGMSYQIPSLILTGRE